MHSFKNNEKPGQGINMDGASIKKYLSISSRTRTSLYFNIVLAAIIVILISYAATPSTETQLERNRLIQSSIKQVEKKLSEVHHLQRLRESIYARISVIDALTLSKYEAVRIFTFLSTSLPDNLYLTKVSRKGEELRIDGISYTNGIIVSLMHEINRSDILKKPRLISTKRQQDGNISFTVVSQISKSFNVSRIKPSGTMLASVSPSHNESSSFKFNQSHFKRAKHSLAFASVFILIVIISGFIIYLRKSKFSIRQYFQSAFRETRITDISTWPTSLRIMVVLEVSLVVFLVTWINFIEPANGKFENEARKEKELMRKLETKQHLAANLHAYKEQMSDIEKRFASLLRQLPYKHRIEESIIDLNQSALATGNRLNKTTPQQEIFKEFYAQLPIDIQLSGTFNELGQFVSTIASLPMLYNIENFTLTPAGKRDLNLAMTVKISRYVDESELEEKSRHAKSKRKRRR